MQDSGSKIKLRGRTKRLRSFKLKLFLVEKWLDAKTEIGGQIHYPCFPAGFSSFCTGKVAGKKTEPNNQESQAGSAHRAHRHPGPLAPHHSRSLKTPLPSSLGSHPRPSAQSWCLGLSCAVSLVSETVGFCYVEDHDRYIPVSTQ